MRITIIGQKWLAAELLQQCLRDGHQVTAVYAPNSADRLFQAAAAHGVPAQTALPAALPECDVILAAHAHVFIPKSLRDQARYGAVGYHPSLLPRHRGRAPYTAWTTAPTPAASCCRTGATSAPPIPHKACGSANSPQWGCACSANT